uniref:Uncharacterized protein n=1 Tax=Nelumbo nucifera TaxID=4432 RepID=A0A822YF64_NELNU|nr:TPA_asm: hypothetical protein HUJ06_009988 [Nelumbo nucifera]
MIRFLEQHPPKNTPEYKENPKNFGKKLISQALNTVLLLSRTEIFQSVTLNRIQATSIPLHFQPLDMNNNKDRIIPNRVFPTNFFRLKFRPGKPRNNEKI